MTTPAALDALFANMRRSASARGFSRGMESGRSGAVHGVQKRGDEIVVRVRAPGLALEPTVVLYPHDDSWTCDCNSSDDACEHAIAAISACRKLAAAGGTLGLAETA